jgi:glucose-6-phosphate 1-dehydrogenase
MFRNVLGDKISANRLIIGIQPDEKISLTFQTKGPGAHVYIRSVTMDFQYLQGYTGPVLDPYEKELHDVIEGNHMFFWRQDGVELCWSYLTPIIEYCETCKERAEQILPYESGSWGPKKKRLNGSRYYTTDGSKPQGKQSVET